MKRCLACFRKCEDSVQSCPHCGYGSDSFIHSSQALPIGTLLCGKILTGKAEIADKNTIRYFAFDNQTQKSLILEEYFPKELLSGRKGTKLVFRNDEAATAARSAISECEDGTFVENNTYYRIVKPLPPVKAPEEKNKKSIKAKSNKIFRNVAYISAIICLVLSVSYLANYYIIEPWKHRKNTSELQQLLQNTVASDSGVDPLEEMRKKYPGVDFPSGMNPNYAELYAINNEFAGQLTISGLRCYANR